MTQSALISPEKAEEQLTSLIVSEIQEILEDDDVAALADYERIINWLDDRRANGLAVPVSPDLTADEFYAGLKQLIRDGVRKTALTKLKTDHGVFIGKIVVGEKKEPVMYIRNALTSILRSHPQAPHEADELWTMLMSLRHRYSNPAPALTLGTVVCKAKGKQLQNIYCVCSRCAIAFASSLVARFPCMQLTPTYNSKNCDLIVRDGQLKFFQLKPSPYLLEMIPFPPNRNEKVMADSDGQHFLFSASDDVLYRWVG